MTVASWGRRILDGIERFGDRLRALEDRGIPVGRINGIAILLVAWYTLSIQTPANVLPTPGQLVSTTLELFRQGIVVRNLVPTFVRTVLGFVGALGLGVAVGVVIGLNDYAQKFFTPYVMILLSISGVSAAAIWTLIFGFESFGFGFATAAPVGATVIVVFPYIAINIWKGTEDIEWPLVEMSRAYGVSHPRLLRRMVLPNVAPSLFAAFRFGLATAWKIVTITEIFAASSGLGYKLVSSYSQYQFHNAWAWGLIFIVILLVIEYGLFKPLERRAFRYRGEAYRRL